MTTLCIPLLLYYCTPVSYPKAVALQHWLQSRFTRVNFPLFLYTHFVTTPPGPEKFLILIWDESEYPRTSGKHHQVIPSHIEHWLHVFFPPKTTDWHHPTTMRALDLFILRAWARTRGPG